MGAGVSPQTSGAIAWPRVADTDDPSDRMTMLSAPRWF
jgi:hypothetical protein